MWIGDTATTYTRNHVALENNADNGVNLSYEIQSTGHSTTGAVKCVNGGGGFLAGIRSGESRSAERVEAQSNVAGRSAIFRERARLSALDDSQALSTKRLFTPGVPDRLFVGATPLRDLYGRLPRDDRQRL